MQVCSGIWLCVEVCVGGGAQVWWGGGGVARKTDKVSPTPELIRKPG